MYNQSYGYIDLGLTNFIIVVIYLTILVLLFVLSGYIISCVGKKNGVAEHLMAYFPITNGIYLLRIKGFPGWKVWFFGLNGLFLQSVIYNISITILPQLSVLFVIGYMCSLIYLLKVTFKYWMDFWEDYNINKYIVFTGIAHILFILLAFSDIIETKQTIAKKGKITGVKGSYAGVVFNMEPREEIIMGRDASISSIVFDDDMSEISKKHCSIQYDSATESYFVMDFSKNGTYTANGNRISHNGERLTAPCKIYLADESELFELL